VNQWSVWFKFHVDGHHFVAEYHWYVYQEK